MVGRKEKLGQLNDSNISFSIQYCLSKKTHLNTRWYKHTDSCKMFIVTSYFVFLISVFKSNVHKSDCCQIQNQNVWQKNTQAIVMRYLAFFTLRALDLHNFMRYFPISLLGTVIFHSYWFRLQSTRNGFFTFFMTKLQKFLACPWHNYKCFSSVMILINTSFYLKFFSENNIFIPMLHDVIYWWWNCIDNSFLKLLFNNFSMWYL